MNIFFLIILLAVVVIYTFIYLVTLIGLLRARGVPFVKTRKLVLELLLKNLRLKQGDIFLDLGCGDGEILSYVTKKFPKIKAQGYEIAPIAYFRAKSNQKKDQNRYEIINKNFFKADLSKADVIYSYLMLHLMSDVWKKITQDCKPGTLLYSYAFPVSEVKPKAVYKVCDKTQKASKLYVYEV